MLPNNQQAASSFSVAVPGQNPQPIPEAPVVLFTEFRFKNPDGEFATVNYTIRAATDDEALQRLAYVVGMFTGGKVDGRQWEQVSTPRNNGGYGGGRGGGGGGHRASNASADIPNNRFRAFACARVVIDTKDKKTGQPVRYEKLRYYSEDGTMFADEFGATFERKQDNALALGIVPHDFAQMVPHKPQDVIPESDRKPFPKEWNVQVIVAKGQYGYEVAGHEVAK